MVYRLTAFLLLRLNSYLILPEVMAEVVYVLIKYYLQPKENAVNNLLQFLTDANCDFKVLFDALETFNNSNFDFVDCLLYGYSKDPNYIIFTFDKKLQKLIEANLMN
jgi:predicted nucleic-acid-binding protein